MKLSQVRSEKEKLTEHRVDVLEITKERKKYLIEKILEAYYGEKIHPKQSSLTCQIWLHTKRSKSN